MSKDKKADDVPMGNDDKPLPKHGTGHVADAGGPVPRVVDQLDRAPKGFARFKIRCNNWHPQKTRYVLAKPDEAGRKAAIDCYLKANGLDKAMARVKANGTEPEPPDLVVTELAD
jgi:hypothetical protein